MTLRRPSLSAVLGLALVATAACNTNLGPTPNLDQADSTADGSPTGGADAGAPPADASVPTTPVTLAGSSTNNMNVDAPVCQNFQNGQPAGHLSNIYYRSYDMNGLGLSGDLVLEAMEVGVQVVDSLDSIQAITVKVHTLEGTTLSPANLTEIGSGGANLSNNQDNTLLTIPVSGVVPAGSTIIAEVNVPDGNGRNFFAIGANADPEISPGFLVAPDCGVNTPTPVSSVAGTSVSLVINIVGGET